MGKGKNMPSQANESVDVSEFPTREPSEAELAITNFMQGSNPLSPQEEKIISEDSLPNPEEKLSGLDRALDDLAAAPELTYEERLAKMNIDMDTAMKIIDTLLEKGEFLKTYRLTKKTSVTFRTRGVRAQDRLQEKIEDERPAFMGTMGLIMSKMNLAASLAKFGDKEFKLNAHGEPKDAEKFVRNLPYPIFNLLLQKLRKFDELVLTVLDEGAVENF